MSLIKSAMEAAKYAPMAISLFFVPLKIVYKKKVRTIVITRA